MDLNKVFQNIALSTLWGVIFFFIAIRDFVEPQTGMVIGLLAFVVVLITLWLVIDMELDEETGELVRAILWGTGIGFGGLMLCLALAGLLA